jgi:hypothetical protein
MVSHKDQCFLLCLFPKSTPALAPTHIPSSHPPSCLLICLPDSNLACVICYTAAQHQSREPTTSARRPAPSSWADPSMNSSRQL